MSNWNVADNIATLICLDVCARVAVIGYCWGCFSPSTEYVYGGRYSNRCYRGGRVVVVHDTLVYPPRGDLPRGYIVVYAADAENLPPLETLPIARR